MTKIDTTKKTKAKPAADPTAVVASAPAPAPAVGETTLPKARTKLEILTELLRRPGGAGVEEMMQATGWQAHSVRGALAGGLKKKGLVISSRKSEAGRRYHVAEASER